MKLQNRAILQFRLLGAWGENLIWAFLQREEAGPGEAERLPVCPKPRRALRGPGSLPGWAGAVEHAPLTQAGLGHGWSLHTLLRMLSNKSVHKHLCVYVLRPVVVEALSSVGTDTYKHPGISVYLVTQHDLTQMPVYSFYRCHPLKGCSSLAAAPPPSSPLCLVSPGCDISS